MFFFGVNQLLSRTAFLSTISAEPGSRIPIFSNISVYGQDTWKVNPQLTLTYGIRWEVNPAPVEKNGNDARTLVGFDDPATTVLAPPGTKLYRTTYNNFAPRIGLSYMLRQQTGHETVLRGGFGVFYDLNSGQTANAYSQGVFPYAVSKNVFFAPFPLSPANAAPPPINPVPTDATIYAFDPNLELPYTLQYNLGVEQSLGANQTLSASYVAARGRRLLRHEGFSLLPSFQAIHVIRNSASSDYDSFQTQYQRRFSRGLQALASYTFSKSLDNASNDSFPLPSIARIDPREDRGPSDFDVRHIFSAAATYSIPAPKAGEVGNAILHGWSVDSIVRAQSAPTANVTTGAILFDAGTARPDVVPGIPLYVNDQSAPGGTRINRSAFIAPPVEPSTGVPTRQGTLGRNALRGYPLFQTDVTLRRQFNLTERVYLQFRTDFFNVFNHPNFAKPCLNLSSCGSQFGTPLSMLNAGIDAGGSTGAFNPLYQVGGPRSIQFSLKLQF